MWQHNYVNYSGNTWGQTLFNDNGGLYENGS